MIAALAVWLTASAWPDLLVAGIMAGLFLWSSALILRQAWHEYQESGHASEPTKEKAPV
jgi:Co/Zn/Cd efflux system component